MIAETIVAKASGIGTLMTSIAGVGMLALSDSAITSIAAVFIALFSTIGAWFSYRSKIVADQAALAALQAKVAAEEGKKVADHTKDLVNSRMTEFMAMAQKYYLALGNKEGKAEQKAEQSKNKM